MIEKNQQKKLVMCGCHVGGMPVIKSLLEQGYHFDYFVCLTKEQARKAKVSGYADYTQLAEQYSIPIYHPVTYQMKSEADLQFFQENRFDILIQGGWQRLFPNEIINTLSIGAVGLHGSSDFLPKGRGRSPLNWSLIEGRKRFIMHLFLIKPGVDDGDVFDREFFDITEFDDIETLYYKYAIVYRHMMLRSLPKLISGELTLLPQQGKPSYYPKRTAKDGLIDWEEMDVWEIYNAVRAQTRPYPGAFGKIGDFTVKIWKCRVFDTRITFPEAKYGECVDKFGKHWIVCCRGGLLLLDDFEVES